MRNIPGKDHRLEGPLAQTYHAHFINIIVIFINLKDTICAHPSKIGPWVRLLNLARPMTCSRCGNDIIGIFNLFWNSLAASCATLA